MNTPTQHPLADFHPIVRSWFEKTFGAASPPQEKGWPSISAGNNTLILAPTGSGKTLAAFLWAINHLVEQHINEDLKPGVRILYVSPLKALNNDIERNLEHPLRGIREEAKLAGIQLPRIRTAVRTGDTPQSKRTAMLTKPPDILITTPESLYLMLTAKKARKILTTIQYVIVDEIHAICGNKRGVHLSLSVERLAAITEQEFVRIGLSATQRPLEEIAAFLGGDSWSGKTLTPRPVTIVDAGRRKMMDLKVKCAAPDFSILPQESVWPLVFVELLENIKRHTTTLIFVNNRRLAERIAAKLNEMILGEGNTFHLYSVPNKTEWSGEKNRPEMESEPIPEGDTVKAYHGSMSRHARENMEEALKGGKLRALVATSSLELGIDIGSIDLVIQIQSPKGVARGLQRVGRSGHLITATSKGRIYPTYREDLVESVVVSKSMMEHEVEFTNIPKDCLDVLAQQIVAMVSIGDWEVDELYDLVRQSYCYRNLSKKLYSGVLQMLSGRYTNEAFRELRARISWDKVNNTLRALPGSGHLAIMSGGTIADRGYFGVYLEDGKTKVGEVDEEFIYESRAGDTFILGSNVWRISQIDQNKVTVSAAPGEPARMPFWRGDGIGRSYELSEQVGAFRRAMADKLDDPDCLTWLAQEYPLDSASAWNIQEYFRKQRDIVSFIPHDQLLVVEGFRDEIGDPRIILHSPFGRRVNGLLGLVLVKRLQETTGVEAQMLYNDNGVLLRCPDMDILPLTLLDGLTISEAEEIVLEGLLFSPLFGGQFRQNAARALLMPKIGPGKRTPLWLQRLRAGDLLQIARQYDDFPIVIETIREVLHDVLDFDHFKEVMQKVESGIIRIETSQTEVPSPFAASLLFDFISVYMYEWDQPKADRQSQYLAVNRELLSEIVGLDSLQSLLRPEAIEAVEQNLQHSAEGYKVRSPEELYQLLLRVGDMSEEEILQRSADDGKKLLSQLQSDGRAISISFGEQVRWIAGEEEYLYRDIKQDRELHYLIHRYLQTHGPTTSADISARYHLEVDAISSLLERTADDAHLVRGKFRPGHPESEEWCYKPNLEKIHRQTISILRKEIRPSTLSEFTDFLFHWQRLAPAMKLSGVQGTQTCITQLHGLSLPSEIWERDIFHRRVGNYTSDHLDQISTTGTVVWTGAGSGKLRPILRGEGNVFLTPPSEEIENSLGDPGKKVLNFLRKHGASFFQDVRGETSLSLDALNNGIADLFWKGFITNDVFAEVRNVKKSSQLSDESPREQILILHPHHNPRKKQLMRFARNAIRQVPGWTGRWSLIHTPGIMGEAITLEEQAHSQALSLLDRYGIVARELLRREEILPWPIIATEYQKMEMRGELRRGYFVEGLSGMQYALPAAVEEIRRLKSSPKTEPNPIIVNACDPANPFGVGVQLPFAGDTEAEPRFARVPGNFLAFERGIPFLLLENYGARIWNLSEFSEPKIRQALAVFLSMIQFPSHLQPFKSITVEYCDGERPMNSNFGSILRSLGFRRDKNQTMQYDGYV